MASIRQKYNGRIEAGQHKQGIWPMVYYMLCWLKRIRQTLQNYFSSEDKTNQQGFLADSQQVQQKGGGLETIQGKTNQRIFPSLLLSTALAIAQKQLLVNLTKKGAKQNPQVQLKMGGGGQIQTKLHFCDFLCSTCCFCVVLDSLITKHFES